MVKQCVFISMRMSKTGAESASVKRERERGRKGNEIERDEKNRKGRKKERKTEGKVGTNPGRKKNIKRVKEK